MHDEFQYWYVYYDAYFLKKFKKPPSNLLNGVDITEHALKKWPKAVHLPEISICFSALQKLLTIQDNWKTAELDEIELAKMEQRLNSLLTSVYIDKKYALYYWNTRKRRIQASVVHFFITLRRLIVCLISEQYISIKACRVDRKLPISMKKIEELINLVLANLPAIQKFLLQPDYQEEANLTQEFLHYVREFIIKLPQSSKVKLEETSRLMKYLMVINLIDVYSQQKTTPRILACPRSSLKVIAKGKSTRLLNSGGQKQRGHSCPQGSQGQTQIAAQVFKFSQNIRKYSIYMNRTKPTQTTSMTVSKFILEKTVSASSANKNKQSPPKKKSTYSARSGGSQEQAKKKKGLAFAAVQIVAEKQQNKILVQQPAYEEPFQYGSKELKLQGASSLNSYQEIRILVELSEIIETQEIQ